MSAAATQQAPVIPPRPSRSQEKAAMPTVPPRPINRRIERSVSPNPARFAPSPLNESPFLSKSPRSSHLSVNNGDPVDRSTSVDLPSLGEEGNEYANLSEELSSSPEQTRTVGDDVKLHAPKPSLPASSAKQRVMTVTRTDSDKAASFGIGKPSSVDDRPSSNRSLKKKASTTSQLSNTESHIDDELGIPEIGQQVPMYPNAGDVQAPSPAPVSGITEGLKAKAKHHTRKTSAHGNLPPGSYGLHGHGVVSRDKLEAAYFDKHPELLKKEHVPHHHDRPNDFSMSSADLNKIVRETSSASKDFSGTPSDQIGWQAIDETTSRVASPLPGSAAAKDGHKRGSSNSDAGKSVSEDGEVIHVDEPRRKSVMFSDDESQSAGDGEERTYSAPILAEDEVAKDPTVYEQPAVAPPLERSGSSFEMEEPSSRPTSRPASLYKDSFEVRSTPLEDVKEYEPLFPEDDKSSAPKKAPAEAEGKQRFPSRDVWEDAPNSVHYTAEVSTPEVSDTQPQPAPSALPTPREGETPAQAFARHQEELADKESREHAPEGSFPPRGTAQKSLWVPPAPVQPKVRHFTVQRFPSRDIWEDSPDSLQLETTVSGPQRKLTDPNYGLIERERPAMPERPKPRQGSGDDHKPVIPDRPKPQIPARPAKSGPTESGEAAAGDAAPRAKPAVPTRPMGSKIAALQAGFMNDLNNRLRLGPQAPKKEDPPAAEEGLVEEKEKAPLSDARKGRARGPQRRAPAKSPSPAAAPAPVVEEVKEAPKFVFTIPSIIFEIDPEEGVLSVNKEVQEVVPEPAEEVKPEEPELKEEVPTAAAPIINEPQEEEAEAAKVVEAVEAVEA